MPITIIMYLLIPISISVFFGKRGEGPGESIYAANIRFAGQDTVWVLDDGKGRMYQYSGIAGGKLPNRKGYLLDKRLFRSLDLI